MDAPLPAGRVTEPDSPAPPPPPAAIGVRRVLVTPILIGICVLVFVAMLVAGVSPFEPETSQLVTWGATYGPRTLNGEWWRLLSSMFVHIGFLHLLLNGVCLWQLGVLAEPLLGPRRFTALYILSGVGGGVLSLAIHPLVVAAGASGAIFGLAGASLALHYWRKLPFELPSIRAGLGRVLPFVLYNLLGGLRGGIDNAAHLGGLATGLLLGALVPLPRAPGAVEPEPRARTGVAFAGVVIALIASGVAVARVQAPVAAFAAANESIDAGNAAASLPLLHRVVTQRPGFAAAHFSLGFAYLQMNSVKPAVIALQAATRLDPSNADYANELGAAYYRLEQYDSALAAFSRTVELESISTRGHFNKGLTLLSAGRAPEAVVEFRAALALDPDSLQFRLLIAEAYLAADSIHPAIAALDTLLRRRPNHAAAHYFRGSAYEELGDLARARADLRAAASADDTTAESRNYAAQARERLARMAAPSAP